MRPKASHKTVRALFARSGNVCAFPECPQPLIVDSDILVGRICHICSARPKGPRYESTQSDDERRSIDNLILLCHQHHVIVDSRPADYPAHVLRRMKREHEQEHAGESVRVAASIIKQVAHDLQAYWSDVERLHRARTATGVPAVPISSKASALELLRDLHKTIDWLSESVGALQEASDRLDADAAVLLRELGYGLERLARLHDTKNPFINWQWEVLNLGLPNVVTIMRKLTRQLEIHTLEAEIRKHPGDPKLLRRLQVAKKRFHEIASSQALYD